MTRRALKRKGSIDVNFLRNYRGEFFFFFEYTFQTEFQQSLVWGRRPLNHRSVAFVFCSSGMGRWYEEMCFFFFFFCNRERTGEQPLQTGWRKLIKIKHFWKFPLTHFRCKVTLVGEPQLENSLLWFSRFYLPKYSGEHVQISTPNRIVQSEQLAIDNSEKKQLKRNKCGKHTFWYTRS